ncbi:helix-turn-helix transcriptional regulator, partial
MILTFGDKLKKIRTERNMSQEELGELLGTSKQVISRYETNQRTPKITVVEEYARKLNVPLEYLVNHSIPEISGISQLKTTT